MRTTIGLIIFTHLLACSGGSDSRENDVTVDTRVDDRKASQCGPGLVAWPGGGCAPVVDACPDPWALPRIGGGCLVVGPRACPATWGDEDDTDCQARTTLPCQAGFVETEDGVACIPDFSTQCGDDEIALLGSECLPVGPQWGSTGTEPTFDDCLAGELALPGSGCVAVGPRACSALWDPQETGCEAGQLLPCAEGWEAADDGAYCIPLLDECGKGERPLFGGGCQRVVPEKADCPAGPFPAVPEGEVLFVSADSSCEAGCGLEQAPYPNIQAAVDAAGKGAHVLVAPGSYDEGVVVTDEVHIVGACGSTVVLMGGASPPDDETLAGGLVFAGSLNASAGGLRIDGYAHGVVVVGGANVTLASMDISADGYGLYVEGSTVDATRLWIHDMSADSPPAPAGMGLDVVMGGALTLSESLVESALATGIMVTGNAEAVISDSTVRATQLNGAGKKGYGLLLSGGSTAQLENCVLDGNGSVNIKLTDAGTQLSAQGCVVRDGQVNGDGAGGYGLQLGYGSSADFTRGWLDGNTAMGLGVFNAGTSAIVRGTVIRGTRQNDLGDSGSGVEASQGAELLLSGCLLDDNTKAGIATTDAGTIVTVAGTVIRRTKLAASGTLGTGIGAETGTRVFATHTLLEENDMTGIAAGYQGTEVELEACTIRNTRSLPDDGLYGVGFQATNGAAGVLKSSLVEDNVTMGIMTADEGSSIVVENSVVRKTTADGNGEFGMGLQATYGASLTVRKSVAEANTFRGILVDGANSKALLEDVILRATALNPTGTMGSGGVVQGGGALILKRCLVEDNTGVGIGALDPESSLTLFQSVVRETAHLGIDKGGRGLQASQGATLLLDESLVEKNHGAGLIVFGEGTSVDVTDTVFRDMLPDAAGEFGRGIELQGGSSVKITASLFSHNRELALFAVHEGTTLAVHRTVIRDTQPNASAFFGRGVEAQSGAHVELVDSLLDRQVTAGLFMRDEGTHATVVGSVLRNTEAGEAQETGRGIEVLEGATLALRRSLLEANSSAALLVGGKGSAAEVTGCIVRGTRTIYEGQEGIGLAAIDEGHLSVHDCLVEGNTTAGLAAVHGAATLSVDGTAVSGTAGGGGRADGEYQSYGDGLFVGESATAEVTDSIFADNDRCGLYYHQASGSIRNSIVTGNSSYGLGLEDSDASVDWKNVANHIFGNSLDLPTNLAAEVSTSPGGLSIPPAPQVGTGLEPTGE